MFPFMTITIINCYARCLMRPCRACFARFCQGSAQNIFFLEISILCDKSPLKRNSFPVHPINLVHKQDTWLHFAPFGLAWPRFLRLFLLGLSWHCLAPLCSVFLVWLCIVTLQPCFPPFGSFGYSWPLWPRLVPFCPVRLYLALFENVWHCKVQFGPFWLLLGRFGSI